MRVYPSGARVIRYRGARMTRRAARPVPAVGDPRAKVGERTRGEAFALQALVTHRRVELVDEPEIGVHRLKVARVGFPQVAIERPDHRRRRRQTWHLAVE